MEGDTNKLPYSLRESISIHSLRMEGDITHNRYFLICLHFNPLPPHGGRLTSCNHKSCTFCISIHSLRMEGDPIPTASTMDARPFQSTPSAWRETAPSSISDQPSTFQSTPSAWRETVNILWVLSGKLYFNPLPPHGGRRPFGSLPFLVHKFQSTPSAWRETKKAGYSVFAPAFQSTPSAWRETLPLRRWCRSPYHFNPLPPHGGRRRLIVLYSLRDIFQSTPSAWRETAQSSAPESRLRNFNPLPPHGGRRRNHPHRNTGCAISIHSLRMEGDAAETTY